MPKSKRFVWQRKTLSRGFTLIELLCVIAVVILMCGVTSMAVGTITGNRFSGNAYLLAGMIESAKTTAMAKDTFIWLGFYHAVDSTGAPVLYVATVSANNGQLADLSNGAFGLMSQVTSLRYVSLVSTTQYPTQFAGLQSGATDISQSTYTFSAPLPGTTIPVLFTPALAFGPDGEIRLNNATVTRYMGIELQSGMPSAANPLIAELQLTGLSGQVAVFY